MSQIGDWFDGRVVLVTGASSGMGQATAIMLAGLGAKVGIHYRSNRAGADEALKQIQARGKGDGVVIQADVAKRDDIERMFGELEAAFGPRLGGLVNNAGDWMDKELIVDCREQQWDHIFDVNVKSVFLCCQIAAKKMIAQKEGSIVNLGSIAGHGGGGGGTVPYAAAKAAVHTFTRGLAKELAPHNIRVNCVAPGLIHTPMITTRLSDTASEGLKKSTPLGRFGEPKEIAYAITYLLSPAASFITGEIHNVNGGLLVR
jgi:3-oxoacyl-[acyl-carrier protein] reductase